jgi:hypothetical protein
MEGSEQFVLIFMIGEKFEDEFKEGLDLAGNVGACLYLFEDLIHIQSYFVLFHRIHQGLVVKIFDAIFFLDYFEQVVD